VFTEKIEKMLEKFLNRSSWILFCCLRLEEKKKTV
jgi:cob(I)alamin adenosyltransferase